MSRLSPKLLLVLLLLLVVGGGMAGWIFHAEGKVVADLVAKKGPANTGLNDLRPWAVSSLALVPFLSALLYACGDLFDRYFGRALLKVLGLVTGALLAIWFLADFNGNVDDFRNSENGWQVGMSYYLSQFPVMVSLMLPYSLLISMLYTLGKFSRSNEIIALLQSGRSLFRMTVPFLLVGLLASYVCMVFNFHWAAQADTRGKAILEANRLDDEGRAGARDVTYHGKSTGRIWQLGFVPADYAEGGIFEQVVIEQFASPGQLAWKIEAAQAAWDRPSGAWQFWDALRVDFSVEPPMITRQEGKSAWENFSETPWQLLNPSLQPAQRGIPSLVERLADSSISMAERRELRTQRDMRFASAFSCLVVVLLSVPLGIVFSRTGAATGVASAIFIGGAMLFCQQVIPSFGEAGYLPSWLAAWATNLLFGGVAIYLINRRIKGLHIYEQIRSLFLLRPLR